MEVNEEFINTLLNIVNLNSNSKVRSKAGYGVFEIKEEVLQEDNKLYMELYFKPTKVLNPVNTSLIRKVYDLNLHDKNEFKYWFYREVITFLTASKITADLISKGTQPRETE